MALQMRSLYRRKLAGFSLLETMFAMLIMLIMGMSVITGIIYTRTSMELEKQRLAALSYARRTMEEAQNTTSLLRSGQMTLVPFNAPGLEIAAEIGVNFFRVNADGTIDPNPMESVDPRQLALCRVTVVWTPAGSMSKRPQQISVQGLVAGGTTL